jgi:hypothetical protein
MSLRRWANSGRLRCRRIGVRGERRFAVADLETFLQPLDAQAGLNGGALARHDPIAVLDARPPGTARHVCSHFSGAAESWRSFAPYFRHHAARDAPIVYLHDSTSAEQFLNFVRDDGWNVDALVQYGLLQLVHSNHAYLRTGTFVAGEMLAYVGDVLAAQRARGHEVVLISGEMTWSLRGAPGSDEMIAYEARLNDLLADYPGATIVCHYRVDRFDARLTLDALQAHPFVHLPAGLFTGLYASNDRPQSHTGGFYP